MTGSEAAKAGNRRREARRRATLAERGIRPLTLSVPEIGHPGLKAAAKRMRAGEDPDAALRAAGGGNQAPDDERETAAKLSAAELAEAESQLSDASELVDQVTHKAIGWQNRAEKAEKTLRQARAARGIFPVIARYILHL